MPALVSVHLYTSCHFYSSFFKGLCEYAGSPLTVTQRLYILPSVAVICPWSQVAPGGCACTVGGGTAKVSLSPCVPELPSLGIAQGGSG